MRLADRLSAALGQANVLEQAFVAQLDERLHDLLDRTRLVHASAFEGVNLGGRKTLWRQRRQNRTGQTLAASSISRRRNSSEVSGACLETARRQRFLTAQQAHSPCRP